jgi:hypothetical protein
VPEERVTDLYFFQGSARLTYDDKEKLDEFILRMKQDQSFRAQVNGYRADNEPVDWPGRSYRTSESRAKAVKDYLVTRGGIDPSRITTEDRGTQGSTGKEAIENAMSQDARAVAILTVQSEGAHLDSVEPDDAAPNRKRTDGDKRQAVEDAEAPAADEAKQRAAEEERQRVADESRQAQEDQRQRMAEEKRQAHADAAAQAEEQRSQRAPAQGQQSRQQDGDDSNNQPSSKTNVEDDDGGGRGQ